MPSVAEVEKLTLRRVALLINLLIVRLRDLPFAVDPENVFQSIVKSRKSWKTLKGGEIVWPPELEAALIDGAWVIRLFVGPSWFNYLRVIGLENYQPDDSRETRLLGRFPLRNRFISDWIFQKTGKRRTAKQVGSRLQQLRDSCGGKRSKCSQLQIGRAHV